MARTQCSVILEVADAYSTQLRACREVIEVDSHCGAEAHRACRRRARSSYGVPSSSPPGPAAAASRWQLTAPRPTPRAWPAVRPSPRRPAAVAAVTLRAALPRRLRRPEPPGPRGRGGRRRGPSPPNAPAAAWAPRSPDSRLSTLPGSSTAPRTWANLVRCPDLVLGGRTRPVFCFSCITSCPESGAL